MRYFKKYAHSPKSSEWKAYHRVSFAELDRGRVAVSECVKELNMRTNYANKYYKGRFDEKHRHVMNRIGKHLKGEDALGLSLQAIIVSRSLTGNAHRKKHIGFAHRINKYRRG